MTAQTATETAPETGRPVTRRHGHPVPGRVLRRVIVVVVVLVAALAAATGGALAVLAGNLGRADGVFDGLAHRPTKVSPDAVDVLVTSTDLTSVVHVDGDRKRVTMILLPPTSELNSGQGAAPDVGAVERLTGVRIDHYAAFDWSLMAALEPTAGPFWPPYEPAADPRETTQRQEDYLRMVIGGNVHQEMARNPVLLYQFLDTVSSHVTLDREWSVPDLARLAYSLHRIRAWDIQYVTAPSGAAAAAFWDAVRHDQTDHLAELAGAEPGVGTTLQ
jgi:hypothetical protein